MPACLTPDLERIRAAFPALRAKTVFLENAGGSQVPKVVADRIHEYLLTSYVQLGADYPLSRQCTATVRAAHDFVELFVNAGRHGKVILGPSTTALCSMLASCYGARLKRGEQIIVAESGHEANVGPWTRLADRGVDVTFWPAGSAGSTCPLEELESLLSARTRLVALPHVSNLLGEIVDVKKVAALAHEVGARVVVDGVAYAPHRAIDVAAWDVDWYVYSTYKVYGPHLAALFGTHDAIAELHGPNHFFIPEDEVPYKFEPGGVSHEACAGVLGLGDYLLDLTGRDANTTLDRPVVEQAFAIMTACEQPLIERMLDYLNGWSDVRILGPDRAGGDRVGTISFVHRSLPSAAIASAVNARDIGIRHGHMYAYRLCQSLGLEPEDGVVRVSLVHYNTPDEIDRLIDVLDEVLTTAG